MARATIRVTPAAAIVCVTAAVSQAQQTSTASEKAARVPTPRAAAFTRRVLLAVTHMVIDISRRVRQCQGTKAFFLALAAVAAGAFGDGHGRSIVAAQAANPCALLTTDEIQPLAGTATVADGLPNSLAAGSLRCRYAWGTGTGRSTLDVTVNDAARMYAGASPERIKQQLLESVRPETADAVITEVGEAAVFRPDSPAYVGATAFIKGRILQVHLDGVYARDKRDQVIELLKLAAGRL